VVSNLSSQASHFNNYVGYFLSPFDFLKECLTFFRFSAAFKRFVFFRLFILSLRPHPHPHPSPLKGKRRGYLTNQIPETISAVPRTL
jgi:hypothetical protein